MSKVRVEAKEKTNIFKLLFASLVSAVVSLGLILLFALFIKWFNLSDGVIAPINIVIKIISIAVGVIIVTRDGKSGIKKGSMVGAIYIILCYIIFSVLLGNFSLSLSNLWDVLLGVVSGGILGVIFVNIKK